MGKRRRLQPGEGGLVAEFDDRRERDEDSGRNGDPTAQPIRKASAADRGRGVNNRRIAPTTPNGDRAIGSAYVVTSPSTVVIGRHS